MKKLLLALVLVCLAVVAYAQQGKVQKTYFVNDALSAVASNAAEASRTFYIDYANIKHAYEMRGPATVGFDVFYDYTAAAGTITLTCTVGATRTAATRQLTTCTVASGVCTVNIGAGVFTTASLSADTYYWIELGLPATPPVVKCIASHSAPAAGEKFTIDYYLTWE
jgi:hypothetical protein